MEPGRPYRPRVSRETRLLLTTALLAVAALWVLARIRFPDRPTTPNPLPPLLTQLASRPKLDDLASEISQIQARLEPSLVVLNASSAALAAVRRGVSYPVAALRIRDDLAVTLLPSDTNHEALGGQNIVARDSASGLTVVRVPNETPVSPPAHWSPRRLQQPRYLIASNVSRERVSVRPVFVGSLEPVSSPLWPEPVWSVPVGTDLDPGAFVFTNDGELAGLVVMNSGERTIVPGALLVAEADRLLNRPRQPAGAIGVHVQPLTPALVAATGASAGVVVTWVDVNGAAAATLAVGDVIEAVDGLPMSTQQHWDVRLARLVAGESVTLRLRRHGELQEAQLVALPRAAALDIPTLGLTMRRAPEIGAEIVRIDRASVADRAGLQPGDVITLVGDVRAPTPAQVTRAFASAREGQSILVAVTRGDTHHVMILEK